MPAKIHIIYGEAGSGKSTEIRRLLLAKGKEETDRKCILIVPEQATLAAQKSIVSEAQGGVIMNIDVISPMRLSMELFAAAGVFEVNVLDDTAKSLIIKKSAIEHAAELGILAGSMNKQGFVDEMKSLFSEFMMYGISEEDIRGVLDKQEDGRFKEKLSDILVLYKAFNDFTRERFVTAEGYLSEAVSAAKRAVLEKEDEESEYLLREKVRCVNSIVNGAIVCFDDFTGFTPSQEKLIDFIMQNAQEVYFAITMDEKSFNCFYPAERHFYYISEKFCKKIRDLAKKAGCKEVSGSFLSGDKRHENSKDSFGVSINSLGNIQAEIKKAAVTIKELVRDKGFRYGEIAVVTGDLDSYGKKLERELKETEIPCYLDMKPGIFENPLVEFVLSPLDIIATDYSYASVLRFIKNKYGRAAISKMLKEKGFEEKDLESGGLFDEFDNYVLARGIRRHGAYGKSFDKRYRTNHTLSLESIDKVREAVFDFLEPLYTVFIRKSLAGDKLRAFYEMLEKSACYEEIEEKDNFSRSVYEKIIELIGRMYDLLAKDEMDAEEFAEVFNAGIRDMKVGTVPAGNDLVLICDVTRSRISNIKALLLLGANEGKLAVLTENGGLLSDRDREIFAMNDLELAPNLRQQASVADFYIYTILNKAENFLYISYSKYSEDGKELIPASQIKGIKRLLKGDLSSAIEQEGDFDKEDSFRAELLEKLSDDNGFGSFTRILGDIAAGKEPSEEDKILFKVIYDYLVDSKKNGRDNIYKIDLEEIAENAFVCNLPLLLSKENLDMREIGNMSITRLEEFASCPFKEFLEHEVKLEERAEYKISVPDIGNYYHKAMELFGEGILSEGIGWRADPLEDKAVRRKRIEALTNRCVIEALEDTSMDIFESSMRNSFIYEMLSDNVRRSVETILYQVEAGDFTPYRFEQKFEMMLPAGLKLVGKIDRTDIAKGKREDGTETDFIRVIDYKSNKNKNIVYGDCYSGLALQLGVYSNVVEKVFKNNPKSVSVLYFGIQNPTIDESEDIFKIVGDKTDDIGLYLERMKAAADKKITAEMKMKGLTAFDPLALRMTDYKLSNENGIIIPSSASDVIAAKLKKDGQPDRYSELVDTELFKRFGEFSVKKADEIGRRLLSGEVSIKPKSNSKGDAPCEFCKYHGICGFDTRVPGFRRGAAEKMKMAEFFNAI
jgi:ATP-dependent helicase/nuclease subunit B